ncbi:hypothetical protein AB0H29_13290 [Streptomyces thermolilacinus]
MAARDTGVGARPVRDAGGARDNRAGPGLITVEQHRTGPARERQDVGGRAGRQCVAGDLAGHGDQDGPVLIPVSGGGQRSCVK